MAYSVDFTKSAAKELKKLDRSWSLKLLEFAETLADTPRPAGCKKLSGSKDTYRIRLGEYRIVYKIDDTKDNVLVTRVRNRRDAYR